LSERKVNLFVGDHCTPCKEIKELVKQGNFTIDGLEGQVIDMTDVESEEGFPAIERYKLTKIPSAIDESGKACRISIDRENNVVVFKCDEPETSPPNPS